MTEPSGLVSSSPFTIAAGSSPFQAMTTWSRRNAGLSIHSSRRCSAASYWPQCSANASTVIANTAGSSASVGVRRA